MFNRNTIKVSYSWIPSIKAEIHKHNKSILEIAQQKHPDTQLCNCTNKMQRLLNKQCLLRVLSTKRISRKTFLVIKKKFTLAYPKQHLKFAMVTTKILSQDNIIKNDTEISKEYWKVKQQNGIARVKWKVLNKCHA